MQNLLFYIDEKNNKNQNNVFTDDKDYQVDITHDISEAVFLLGKNVYDIVIFDADIENDNIPHILSLIQEDIERSGTDVIIISKKTNISCAIEQECLASGATLFLREEFINQELLHGYIDHIIETNPHSQKQMETITEHINFDYASGEFIYDDTTILSTKEQEIIQFFLQNKNLPLTRKIILDGVWNDNSENISERNVDTVIKNLRKKIKLKNIITVHGIGYKWCDSQKNRR